jgi:DNA-binding MurR/RpiR family transcriptional regulator
MDYTELTSHMSERYPQLSPQLKQAARYVLDQPDDVALNSMRRVASQAGVHPTTMTRLARAFEFGGYNEFRQSFQKRLRSHPADFIGRAQELQSRSGQQFGGVIDEVLEFACTNLKDSFALNSVDRFASCAKVLSEGRRVFVAGTRSCYPIVFYFDYVYSVFRSNSVLMDGSGGTFADRLRSFGEGDVIFAASFEPYSQATVKAVEYALENGGDAVVLTDSVVSPIAANPDHTLIIQNESPSFFQSTAPAMAAVEALVALMVLNDGSDALKAIEESERQLERFDAYWGHTTKFSEQDINK